MVYHESNRPPPLPPRSPQPPVGVANTQSPYSPQQSQHYSPYSHPSPNSSINLPGPPPGPPPRSPAVSPQADVPPPIPPRPPGWVRQELPREPSYSTPKQYETNFDSYQPPPPPRPPKEPITAYERSPALPARTSSQQSTQHSNSHLSPTSPFQAIYTPHSRGPSPAIESSRQPAGRSASTSSTYEEAESSLLETLGSLSINHSSPSVPAQSQSHTPPPQRNSVSEVNPINRSSYASRTVEDETATTNRRSYITPTVEDEPATTNRHSYAPPTVDNEPRRRSYVPPAVDVYPPAPSYPAVSSPPKAFVSCLGASPAAIPGTYAWHKDTPEFIICSKCYVDHIHHSRFRGEFKTQHLDDGKPRTCKFSQPRMSEVLYPSALTSGNLRPVVEWMQRRAQIPNCVGIQGLMGGHGLKWYKPRPDDIPGFVSCEACYEDHLSATSFSSRFALVPPELHAANQAWSCDMALPYLAKLYPEKSKTNDWANFVREAKGRLAFDHCPGNEGKGTYHKLWFVPKNGPEGLVFCSACWADNVLLTPEEDKWRQATEWWEEIANHVQCSLGKLNIKMSMAQSQEKKDYSIFWKTVDKLSKSPPCTNKGITNGEWWTLPSNPQDFGVCKACYVGICEPLNIGHLFKPKTDSPRDVALLCSLHTSCGRFGAFVGKLVEMYFTQDATSFDNFASIWARIPPCKRDQDIEKRSWYGWFDCTICRECYHEFAHKFPAMVSRMELQDTFISSNVLCEMYSPRMRKLFQETAASEPIDLQPMLQYSMHRRQVYMETMPQARMLLFQTRMAAQKQQMLHVQSNFHHNMGLRKDLFFGSSYTYSAVGVGSGFANRDLLQAEQYKQQAMGVVSGMPSATMQVGMLERKWRAVE